LLRIGKALDSLKLTGDEKIGIDILRAALEQPFRMLVKNAGLDDSLYLRQIQDSKEVDFGVNVATAQTGSMLKFGIIDPAKVTRLALQNAASVGTMILTTEALVTELPEKKEAPAMGGNPGMGGMGGMDMGGDY
jgi:chaperonin GroEL